MPDSSSAAAQTTSGPKIPVNVVYVVSLVLAGCSLLYELLIAHTLSLIAGNMVVWYSLTIGTYLGAMGVGAIVYGRYLQDRVGEGWLQLFKLEFVLSIAGAAAVLILHAAHTVHLWLIANAVVEEISALGFYGACFLITFLIGILTGIELPLLIHLGNESAGKDVTNRVLGWDYIGSLGGGVFFPLFLVPFFEMHTIGFSIAGVNLLIAFLAALFVLSKRPGHGVRLAASLGLGAVFVLGVLGAKDIEQFFMKKYYFAREGQHRGIGYLVDPLNQFEKVERVSSPYQKIDVVNRPEPWDPIIDAYSTKFATYPTLPKNQNLFLNGDDQFASNFEELYHEWFAHVPIIAAGRVPKRVLIMGGGDGILHRELIKYDGVEYILHVDLDKKLVDMAREHPMLSAVNLGALADPRIENVYADAFKYMREYDGEPFDGIYLDFPTVRDYNLSRLYTREFYHFVQRAVAADGFAVMDAPSLFLFSKSGIKGMSGTEDEEPYAAGSWHVHYNTMRHAGFKTVVPFFTDLESDNEHAREVLAASERLAKDIERNPALDTEAARAQWVEDYLRRLWRLRMGFIMLRKDEHYGPYDYVDFGVETHLLNEERFGLAFPILLSRDDDVDLGMVNSILRPKLPKGDLREIRSPF